MTNQPTGAAAHQQAAAPASDLAAKVVLSVIIAVVIAVVAAISVDNIVVVLLAVAAGVIGFWAIDGIVAPSRVGDAGPMISGPAGTQPPPSPTAPPTAPSATLDPAIFDPESIEIASNPLGKSRVFAIRVAKHGNAISECEDAVALDPRRGVLAVADGASSSFGAGEWADTLAKQFVHSPPKPLSVGSFATWLGSARSALPAPVNEASDGPNGWWSEQGARQGAFSTVIGAAIMTDGEARVATVMCLGDSCAFVLTGAPGERTVRRSLPYEDATQFGSHPSLLGSMVAQGHDEPTWTTIPTGPGDLLVLASDAVSEWLLADPKRFGVLDGHEPAAIANRLVAERSDGRIVNDDMTLAVLELAS
ncbi:MAG: hypothetical protein AB8G14_01170 [Ilumatobacter sp.]